MLSSALCQHLSALSSSPKPAFRDAIRKHLPRSDVCCYFTWSPKCVRKEKRAVSQRPHCSSRLIVFSSVAMVNPGDGWLTCSFHSSFFFLGLSPGTAHPTVAPQGGIRTWKQRLQKLSFQTFHIAPFETFRRCP